MSSNSKNTLNDPQNKLIEQIVKNSNTMYDNTALFPYFKLLKSDKIPSPKPTTSVPDDIYEKVMQPAVLSRRVTKGNTTKMVLLIGAFINTETILKEGDFIFYNDISLNADGKPQLDIFITFNIPLKGKDYCYYIFEVCFKSDPKEDSQLKLKGVITTQEELEGVVTTQVFLYDEDPKTSRGTETVVQTGE